MSSEYGNDFVELEDEEGNKEEFEHVDSVEIDGETYGVFIPADLAQEDTEEQLVILKFIEVDGAEMLESVEDDEILEKVYGIYIEHTLEDDEDYDDYDDEDDED